MLPDMAIRSGLPELMDDPDCSEELLLRTVRQFASINRLVSRYRTILTRWVLDDMLRHPGREYHLLDMGAGGCDIDAWLLQAAKRRRLKLRITACDLDPRIIGFARKAYGSVAGLQLRQMDLLADQLDEPIDYVFSNHFLHHLGQAEIIRLLRIWQPQVRRRLIFSDLERNRLAYGGYALLSQFYRSSFAQYDGLMSIRRGFTGRELSTLAHEALPTIRTEVHRLPIGRLALCVEGSEKGPENPASGISRIIPKKH
ncbi:MAG: methyltransferase domain-containing protein [Pontiellaceae bacterium]|nr:methyltransferase domain-containing protein [Pontiellaceae bacterium]MBN2783440.1 methyltransferase domain-containing protein [Pontiellaceae bacterium]